MPNNRNLKIAQKAKKDEFYTQYSDIAKELPYYKEQLANKVIYCNCDNPKYSNFYKFFKDNFVEYKLKKLIATYLGFNEYYSLKPTKTVFDGENEIVEPLGGYGDFRSPICVSILQESDIVITNPPFSLFRDFVKLMTEYDKKFLIIGNVNAISYKEVFPLFKGNKMWLGKSIHSGDREFQVPDDYPLKAASYRVDEQGNKYIRVKGVRWFTNIDSSQRYEMLSLSKHYDEEIYPKYENYNAINVDKVADIPYDYDGIMGVPITFLDKYNPKQFEIIGLGSRCLGQNIGIRGISLEHKQQMTGHSANGDLYYLKNGKLILPYVRILIRKKANINSKPPCEQTNSPNK